MDVHQIHNYQILFLASGPPSGLLAVHRFAAFSLGHSDGPPTPCYDAVRVLYVYASNRPAVTAAVHRTRVQIANERPRDMIAVSFNEESLSTRVLSICMPTSAIAINVNLI